LVAGLVGAVVGAILGGAASLMASVIIGRQQLCRTTRINMYDEQLPEIQEALPHWIELDPGYMEGILDAWAEDGEWIYENEVQLDKADKLFKLIEALHRSSVIAGKSDRDRCEGIRKVMSLRRSHVEAGWMLAMERQTASWQGYPWEVYSRDREASEMLRDLENYLAGKIRGQSGSA
jgi:hypothetical protein